MPPLRRSASRGLLAAAILASAALAAWLTPAAAELPSVEVTIVSPKGQEVFAYLNRLSPDVHTDYDIRERGESPRSEHVEEGVSIWNILHSKSLDEDPGSVEIVRPNGTTLRIASDDADDVFFYEDENGVLRLFRVSRGSEDYNARDNFKVVGSAVRLTQTAPELKVELTPDRRKIEPGESVDFDVDVSGAPSGATYRFSWTFGDGSRESSTSGERSHTFDEQGIYSVSVTAKVRGEELSGDGNVVDIEVGDAKEKDEEDDGSAPVAPSSSAPVVPSTPSTPYTPVTPSTPSTPTPPSDFDDVPGVATDGTTVEGNLLADVGGPGASSSLESAARAASDRKPEEDDDAAAGVPQAFLAVAGVLALLGLGAGMELRQGPAAPWAGLRRRLSSLAARLPRRAA